MAKEGQKVVGDHWWSRKPKEERRPLLSSRLLLNAWEFRYPVKVLVAAAGGIVLLAGLLSVVLIALDSSETTPVPEWSAQVSGGTLPAQTFNSTEDSAVGGAAPVARGTSPSGGSIDIGGPRGIPSVVIFVTGWDPHSPGMLRAAQTLAGRGDSVEVTVVASMTEKSGPSYPDPWLADNGWQGRTLVDNKTDDVLNAYGISGLPSTVVVDEKGDIIDRISGELDASALEAIVSNALKQ